MPLLSYNAPEKPAETSVAAQASAADKKAQIVRRAVALVSLYAQMTYLQKRFVELRNRPFYIQLHLFAHHHFGERSLVRIRRIHTADVFALSKDGHAVGDRHDFVQFVRDDDDGFAVCLHRAHDGKELFHPVCQVAGELGHHRADDRPGDIVTTDGLVLGRHKGFWHYTIGQRKGLGIAAPRPLYVLELDSVSNRVIVGFDDENRQSSALVEDVVWTSRTDFEKGKVYSVKVRSTSRGEAAEIEKLSDSSFRVRFISPSKGVTPGQSCVVYDDDLGVAGGIRKESLLDKAAVSC